MRQSVKNCACACINIKCSFASSFFLLCFCVCFLFFLFFFSVMLYTIFYSRAFNVHPSLLFVQSFSVGSVLAICYITRLKYGLSKIVHVNTHSHTNTPAHCQRIYSRWSGSVYWSHAHNRTVLLLFFLFPTYFHRCRRYIGVVAFAASSENFV